MLYNVHYENNGSHCIRNILYLYKWDTRKTKQNGRKRENFASEGFCDNLLNYWHPLIDNYKNIRRQNGQWNTKIYTKKFSAILKQVLTTVAEVSFATIEDVFIVNIIWLSLCNTLLTVPWIHTSLRKHGPYDVLISSSSEGTIKLKIINFSW